MHRRSNAAGVSPRAASAHLSSTTVVGHRCVGCLYTVVCIDVPATSAGVDRPAGRGPVEFAGPARSAGGRTDAWRLCATRINGAAVSTGAARSAAARLAVVGGWAACCQCPFADECTRPPKPVSSARPSTPIAHPAHLNRPGVLRARAAPAADQPRVRQVAHRVAEPVQAVHGNRQHRVCRLTSQSRWRCWGWPG